MEVTRRDMLLHTAVAGASLLIPSTKEPRDFVFPILETPVGSSEEQDRWQLVLKAGQHVLTLPSEEVVTPNNTPWFPELPLCDKDGWYYTYAYHTFERPVRPALLHLFVIGERACQFTDFLCNIFDLPDSSAPLFAGTQRAHFISQPVNLDAAIKFYTPGLRPFVYVQLWLGEEIPDWLGQPIKGRILYPPKTKLPSGRWGWTPVAHASRS